ncbi:MAG TPA: DUF362 domain-containing protein [Anaerolineales bacterium]
MSKLSRRDFLKVAVAGAGAMSLGAILDACGQAFPLSLPSTDTPVSSIQQPASPSPSPADTIPATTDTVAAPTDTPLPPPDVVVTRGGEPETLVRQAIAALGGMEKFVPLGANVIVKPNICVAYHTYEYAATTNPWVVGTLVKICYEAGAASVKVMDYPFGGTQQKAYEISGIKEQVEAAGGEMANMLSYKYIPTQNPTAVVLKTTAVYDDILKADVLINVPIAKQHGSSRLTLGMKNLMGVIQNRSALHTNLGQCIADLNALIKPQLTVVDAVRILTANGPTGGNLADVKKLDTVIVSQDVVAADSYAALLFGMKPEDLDYIVIGTSMGLGRSDIQNLNVQVIQVDV